MTVILSPFKEDREIEKELSDAKLRRLMAKPSLLRAQVTAMEFRILRHEVERISQVLNVHETAISDLADRITFLETQSRKTELTVDLKAISEQNVRALRTMFNLPETTGRTEGNILAEMKGMLEDYSREDMDSVELLHSIRGE